MNKIESGLLGCFVLNNFTPNSAKSGADLLRIIGLLGRENSIGLCSMGVRKCVLLLTGIFAHCNEVDCSFFMKSICFRLNRKTVKPGFFNIPGVTRSRLIPN